MRLGRYSKKEIIMINWVLVVMIALVLMGGFIYPALITHQLLQNKLAQLQLQVSAKSLADSERMISIAELLKLLKAQPLASLKIIHSSQDAEGVHLVFAGSPSLLSLCFKCLAASHLIAAKMIQGQGQYELALDLEDLRLSVVQELNEGAKPQFKIVGSVLRQHHHYCVIEDQHQRIHLSEAVRC